VAASALSNWACEARGTEQRLFMRPAKDNRRLSDGRAMTTVHQVYTIRSFRSSKDRDFPKALKIYDAYTHPLEKTDSREIAHWLDNDHARKEGKFYVCGLYMGVDLVGYIEFIFLPKERLIHFDYFIIESARRTAGAFYTFADQLRSFFDEENLEWDFLTAEVLDLDVVNGTSKSAQRHIRIFRLAGFSEALAEYEQPLLGIEHPDTVVMARLMILPRVEMDSISKTRYLEIVSAIYRKHYGEWYGIYVETAEKYQRSLDTLLAAAEERLRDKKEIQLKKPEQDFSESTPDAEPPLRGGLVYLLKILLSGVAAAIFHRLLKQSTDYSVPWLIGISLSAFVLLAVAISLTDKKRLEAFKLLISLVSKLFDR
jgi:hypothetical protein